MSAVVFALVTLAGGLGAVCRFLLDGAIRSRVGGRFPWSTIVINVTGSLALGLVTGLASAGALPSAVHLVIGAGFLGGFTTFSTASFETVRLVQEGKELLGALNGIGALVLATAAAGLGIWVGSLF